jgi:hypothetical protein
VAQFVRFALALLSLTGPAAAAGAQTAAPASIEGRVIDGRTGAGLARVSVSVSGGPETLTDAGGRFALPAVGPGQVRLLVSVVGYVLVQRDLTLAPAEALNLTIPLA